MNGPTPKQGIFDIRPHMMALPSGFSENTIKLASNESAFGPSPAALGVAAAATQKMHRYAEQGTAQLQQAIADRYKLDADRIICGPGSDELLTRLCRAYLDSESELIYSTNGYAKFGNYASANNAKPVKAPDQNFTVSVDQVLNQVNEQTRVITIANPDNPTGTYISGSEIRRLHSALPENVLLIVDSAYAEYVDQDDYEVATSLIDTASNVVMTRTFSKIHGLAGLRLGWMYGPKEIVDIVNRIGTTFPISNIALECGIAAVNDTTWAKYVFDQNKLLKEKLYQDMAALNLSTIPSQTNFVLVKFSDKDKAAEAAASYLWKNNIMVRRFPAPAFDQYIRVTIGNESEMENLTTTLQHYMES